MPDPSLSGLLEIGVTQRIELAPFSHGLDLLQPEGSEAYIAAQEEHHRQRTFEQELRELLEKHGVQYDPKYLL